MAAKKFIYIYISCFFSTHLGYTLFSSIYVPVLLLFLLIIFFGTDGEEEFLWSNEAEGDGVTETLIFGECLALLQFTVVTDDTEDGPVLDERTSSVLLVLASITRKKLTKNKKHHLAVHPIGQRRFMANVIT